MSPRACASALLCALLAACGPATPTPPSPDGGLTDAAPPSEGGSAGSIDDPCGVAGTWSNGCGAVELCGVCEGATLPLAAEFTITPEVARRGGTFAAGAATLVFDVGTCTLRSANQFCTPWSDDRFVLRGGVGEGVAFGHCYPGGERCDCEVRTTCAPRRLR